MVPAGLTWRCPTQTWSGCWTAATSLLTTSLRAPMQVGWALLLPLLPLLLLCLCCVACTAHLAG